MTVTDAQASFYGLDFDNSAEILSTFLANQDGVRASFDCYDRGI